MALKESSRRLQLLAEMNVQVNREILLNEDIELIYRTILNYLFTVFDRATTGSVLILGDDGYLTFAASSGFTEEFVNNFHLKLEDCFLYQATGGDIRGTRLIDSEDFRRIETVFEPGEWEYSSVISAPLFVEDRLFGILNLDSPVSGTYNAQDVSIVEQFRTQIEIGLLARERYTTASGVTKWMHSPGYSHGGILKTCSSSRWTWPCVSKSRLFWPCLMWMASRASTTRWGIWLATRCCWSLPMPCAHRAALRTSSGAWAATNSLPATTRVRRP